MPQVPILSGAYASRAIIASSQKCINLFPEANEDKQAPAPVTHFPTPGLVRCGTPPVEGVGRCSYLTTMGHLIEVVGPNVYYVDINCTYRPLGTIPNNPTPVIMADNGWAVLIVDGSPNGWAIDMTVPALTFAPVNDPMFLGGSHVTYLDGFFVLNAPLPLREVYISLAFVTFGNLTAHVFNVGTFFAFDPQDFFIKSGSTDPVAAVTACHRNMWVIGTLNSEVFYNTGAADFPFSAIPGVYIEHGTIAPYSVAVQDLTVFWLSRDRYGVGIVMEGDASFQVKQISPRGLEAIFATFQTLADAVGSTYNILGHFYYVLSFPTAGRTFQYEQKTGEWNELAYTGPNGLERYRGQGWTQAYGKVLTYDYANGRLYEMHETVFTDDGAPITRIRTISHLLNEGKRIALDRVIADLQGGTLGGSTATSLKSVQQIITDLHLTGNLTLLLEAGNTASWSGAGDKWLDESGGGYDFYLGIGAGPDAKDPTFSGAPGGLSPSEFWAFSSSYFTYDAPNEPWMNRLHQNGAKYTIVSNWFNGASPSVLVGTTGGGFGTGIQFGGNGNDLVLTVMNGAGFALNKTVAGAAIIGADHITAVSIDENGGATGGFLFDNGTVVSTFDPAYAGPSAGPANAASMQI